MAYPQQSIYSGGTRSTRKEIDYGTVVSQAAKDLPDVSNIHMLSQESKYDLMHHSILDSYKDGLKTTIDELAKIPASKGEMAKSFIKKADSFAEEAYVVHAKRSGGDIELPKKKEDVEKWMQEVWSSPEHTITEKRKAIEKQALLQEVDYRQNLSNIYQESSMRIDAIKADNKRKNQRYSLLKNMVNASANNFQMLTQAARMAQHGEEYASVFRKASNLMAFHDSDSPIDEFLTASAGNMWTMGGSIAAWMVPVVGPALGAAIIATPMSTESYLDLIDRGVPREEAMSTAAAIGITGAAIELLTGKALGKVLPGSGSRTIRLERLREFFAGTSGKATALARIAKEGGTEALTGGVEEWLQQGLEYALMDEALLNNDLEGVMPRNEDGSVDARKVLSDMNHAFALGMFMEGAMGAGIIASSFDGQIRAASSMDNIKSFVKGNIYNVDGVELNTNDIGPAGIDYIARKIVTTGYQRQFEWNKNNPGKEMTPEVRRNIMKAAEEDAIKDYVKNPLKSILMDYGNVNIEMAGEGIASLDVAGEKVAIVESNSLESGVAAQYTANPSGPDSVKVSKEVWAKMQEAGLDKNVISIGAYKGSTLGHEIVHHIIEALPGAQKTAILDLFGTKPYVPGQSKIEDIREAHENTAVSYENYMRDKNVAPMKTSLKSAYSDILVGLKGDKAPDWAKKNSTLNRIDRSIGSSRAKASSKIGVFGDRQYRQDNGLTKDVHSTVVEGEDTPKSNIFNQPARWSFDKKGTVIPDVSNPSLRSAKSLYIPADVLEFASDKYLKDMVLKHISENPNIFDEKENSSERAEKIEIASDNFMLALRQRRALIRASRRQEDNQFRGVQFTVEGKQMSPGTVSRQNTIISSFAPKDPIRNNKNTQIKPITKSMLKTMKVSELTRSDLAKLNAVYTLPGTGAATEETVGSALFGARAKARSVKESDMTVAAYLKSIGVDIDNPNVSKTRTGQQSLKSRSKTEIQKAERQRARLQQEYLERQSLKNQYDAEKRSMETKAKLAIKNSGAASSAVTELLRKKSDSILKENKIYSATKSELETARLIQDDIAEVEKSAQKMRSIAAQIYKTDVDIRKISQSKAAKNRLRDMRKLAEKRIEPLNAEDVDLFEKNRASVTNVKLKLQTDPIVFNNAKFLKSGFVADYFSEAADIIIKANEAVSVEAKSQSELAKRNLNTKEDIQGNAEFQESLSKDLDNTGKITRFRKMKSIGGEAGIKASHLEGAETTAFIPVLFPVDPNTYTEVFIALAKPGVDITPSSFIYKERSTTTDIDHGKLVIGGHLFDVTGEVTSNIKTKLAFLESKKDKSLEKAAASYDHFLKNSLKNRAIMSELTKTYGPMWALVLENAEYLKEADPNTLTSGEKRMLSAAEHISNEIKKIKNDGEPVPKLISNVMSLAFFASQSDNAVPVKIEGTDVHIKGETMQKTPSGKRAYEGFISENVTTQDLLELFSEDFGLQIKDETNVFGELGGVYKDKADVQEETIEESFSPESVASDDDLDITRDADSDYITSEIENEFTANKAVSELLRRLVELYDPHLIESDRRSPKWKSKTLKPGYMSNPSWIARMLLNRKADGGTIQKFITQEVSHTIGELINDIGSKYKDAVETVQNTELKNIAKKQTLASNPAAVRNAIKAINEIESDKGPVGLYEVLRNLTVSKQNLGELAETDPQAITISKLISHTQNLIDASTMTYYQMKDSQSEKTARALSLSAFQDRMFGLRDMRHVAVQIRTMDITTKYLDIFGLKPHTKLRDIIKSWSKTALGIENAKGLKEGDARKMAIEYANAATFVIDALNSNDPNKVIDRVERKLLEQIKAYDEEKTHTDESRFRQEKYLEYLESLSKAREIMQGNTKIGGLILNYIKSDYKSHSMKNWNDFGSKASFGPMVSYYSPRQYVENKRTDEDRSGLEEEWDFSQVSGRGIERKHKSLADAIAAGKVLRYDSFIDSQLHGAYQHIDALANRSIIESDLNSGLFSLEMEKGYSELKAPGSKAVRWEVVDLDEDVDEGPFVTFDDALEYLKSRKNKDSFIAPIYMTVYAPNHIASYLNAITKPSVIRESEFGSNLLAVNAKLKGIKIAWGMFHRRGLLWSALMAGPVAENMKINLADMKTPTKLMKKIAQRADYGRLREQGMALMTGYDENYFALIHHGMTNFRMQDIGINDQQYRTWIEKRFTGPDKGSFSKAVNKYGKRYAKITSDLQSELFGIFGSTLKAATAYNELESLRLKYNDIIIKEKQQSSDKGRLAAHAMRHDIMMNGKPTLHPITAGLEKFHSDKEVEIMKSVASMMNADFGGLHLDRMGVSKGKFDAMRLLFLGPDWTASNIISALKTYKRKNAAGAGTENYYSGSEVEAEIARTFWKRILGRSAMLVLSINLISAGLDDESLFERYMKAVKAGGFKCLMADISPFIHMMGGNANVDHYLNGAGHFLDPFRIVADPVRMFYHKSSSILKPTLEMLSGTRYDHKRPSHISVIGKKGIYTWKENRRGPISPGEMPAYLLYQALQTAPIQMQNLMNLLGGQENVITSAMAAGLGLDMKRTYE